MIGIKADLHIHSCLSPCGDLSMSPRAIVEGAVAAGLQLIAITDHNTALNAPAVERIVKRTPGIRCFYGLEATTAEEAHCLCIFDNTDAALELGERIYANLPVIAFDQARHGDQVWTDEFGTIEGRLERFLGSSSGFPVSELVRIVHRMGGLCIPAHIDRDFCSMKSQLGYVPEEDFDAVEVYKAWAAKPGRTPVPGSERYRWITDSDSHHPESIGSAWHEYDLAATSPEEITLEEVRVFLRSGYPSIRTRQ